MAKFESVYRKDLDEWRWRIVGKIGKERITRAAIFKTRQEAEDAYAQLRTNAAAERLGLMKPAPMITLGDLRKKVVNDPDVSKRALQMFDQFVDSTGGEYTMLRQLGRADWKLFKITLVERKLKPMTMNRYMTYIFGVLSKAPEYFRELDDWRPPKAKWETDTRGRSHLISKNDFAKILSACLIERLPGEWQQCLNNRRELFDLFRLMLLTSARRGEILELTSQQVRLERSSVVIRSEKGGGSEREIPLSATAIAILRERENSTGRYFTIGKDKVKRTSESIGELSGVVYGDRVPGGWVPYDIRHLAATIMEDSGARRSSIEKIMGHRKKDQTSKYIIALDGRCREAIESLEEYYKEILGLMSLFGPRLSETADKGCNPLISEIAA